MTKDNIPPEIMDSIDKFEDQILLNLVSLSPDTSEKMIKCLPCETSNKLKNILRDNKISQVIK